MIFILMCIEEQENELQLEKYLQSLRRKQQQNVTQRFDVADNEI